MKLSFTEILFPEDREPLVNFLILEEWPFHVNSQLSREKVLEMIECGHFNGSNHQSFWIKNEKMQIVGLVRIFDLDDIDDGYPLFDLRILSEYRGKGIGKKAVNWLTQYLFSKYPLLDKIIGTTRADNFAMRKTFRSSGYVKEGHYRKDWICSDGNKIDSIKYAILRQDWVTGSLTPVNWNDEF